MPQINALARALRTAGATVAWVLPESGGPDPHAIGFFGAERAETYSRSGGSGPPHTRLWPDLEPRDIDVFAEKSAFSAFFPGRCPLPELLEQRSIDTVVITGTITNVCCESSARDASTRGFRLIQ